MAPPTNQMCWMGIIMFTVTNFATSLHVNVDERTVHGPHRQWAPEFVVRMNTMSSQHYMYTVLTKISAMYFKCTLLFSPKTFAACTYKHYSHVCYLLCPCSSFTCVLYLSHIIVLLYYLSLSSPMHVIYLSLLPFILMFKIEATMMLTSNAFNNALDILLIA